MVSAGGGMFRAFFNIEGNAEEKAANIERNVRRLNQTAIQTIGSLESIGGALSEASQKSILRGAKAGEYGTLRDAKGRWQSAEQFMAMGGGQGGSLAAAQAMKISRMLDQLASAGTFTSSTLNKASRQMDILAESSDPHLRESLHELNSELTNTAAKLKMAEAKASGLGAKMSFMGDVSEEQATVMRMVSASAQGAMLSMAALEKNLIGVAFSLIFLQFSGVLKLSLAFAVLSFAGGIAYKQLSKVFSLRKEALQLAKSFFVVTSSVEAANIATDRAEQITKRLGLEGKDATEMNRGLAQAQLALSQKGIEPTSEHLQVFVAAFARAKVAGKDFDEAMQSALTTMVGFAEGGGLVVDVMGGTDLFSIEKLKEEGALALAILTNQVSLLDKVKYIPDLFERLVEHHAGKRGKEILFPLVDETELIKIFTEFMDRSVPKELRAAGLIDPIDTLIADFDRAFSTADPMQAVFDRWAEIVANESALQGLSDVKERIAEIASQSGLTTIAIEGLRKKFLETYGEDMIHVLDTYLAKMEGMREYWRGVGIPDQEFETGDTSGSRMNPGGEFFNPLPELIIQPSSASGASVSVDIEQVFTGNADPDAVRDAAEGGGISAARILDDITRGYAYTPGMLT